MEKKIRLKIHKITRERTGRRWNKADRSNFFDAKQHGKGETWNKMARQRTHQLCQRKKLKICRNALTSHRNTVELYSDLILCSMTFSCVKPKSFSVHGTYVVACLQTITKLWGVNQSLISSARRLHFTRLIAITKRIVGGGETTNDKRHIRKLEDNKQDTLCPL